MNEVSVVPAAWAVPGLAIVSVALTVFLVGLIARILWLDVCEADKSRIRRRVRGVWDVRRIQKGAAALAFLLLGAGTSHAQEKEPVSALMYAGRLVTVAQDDTGKLSRDEDLWALRLVLSAPGPAGMRFGFRGDLTALSYIAPDAIEPTALRSAEGYGAASWSRQALGVSIGPAAFAGALIPVESGSVTWATKWGYGGGLRVGYRASYVYAFVGKDHASDERAGGESPARLIVPFSLEVPIWRSGIAIQGEVVTGKGGRFRVSLMARVPNPWGE